MVSWPGVSTETVKPGNRARINAPPVDGRSGGHLWTERYNRGLEGLGEAKITQMEGQRGGPVHVGGHRLAHSPGNPATGARSDPLTLSDHDISCNVAGKNCLFAPYLYSG